MILFRSGRKRSLSTEFTEDTEGNKGECRLS